MSLKQSLLRFENYVRQGLLVFVNTYLKTISNPKVCHRPVSRVLWNRCYFLLDCYLVFGADVRKRNVQYGSSADIIINMLRNFISQLRTVRYELKHFLTRW